MKMKTAKHKKQTNKTIGGSKSPTPPTKNTRTLLKLPTDTIRHMSEFAGDADVISLAQTHSQLNGDVRPVLSARYERDLRRSPDLILANRTQIWKNAKGQYHRNHDLPAIIEYDGAKEIKKWYKNGKLHRTRGPAVILANGIEKWYQYDKLHRDGGPAVFGPHGLREFWIRGERRSPFNINKPYDPGFGF